MRIIAKKGLLKRGFKKKLLEFLKDTFPSVYKKLEIVIVGENTMRKYNMRYTGSSIATDVLAFDIGDTYTIIVCSDTARKNAIHYGERYENELVLYIVHGILHLTGYDHKVQGKEELMRRKEEELMKKWKTLYYS